MLLAWNQTKTPPCWWPRIAKEKQSRRQNSLGPMYISPLLSLGNPKKRQRSTPDPKANKSRRKVDREASRSFVQARIPCVASTKVDPIPRILVPTRHIAFHLAAFMLIQFLESWCQPGILHGQSKRNILEGSQSQEPTSSTAIDSSSFLIQQVHGMLSLRRF